HSVVASVVNPSGLAPALMTLAAKIRLFGPKGARDVAAGQFFVTPKTNQEREYALKTNAIVTELLVPPTGGARNATYEVRQKEALDWPLAAAAVSLRMSGKKRSEE